MSNPAPTLNQINAFNATQGTTIDFNIIGGTEVIRSNKIYIYDLSDNSLICTHLYVSTESIHELPPNTSSSIIYADGKTSADFTNNTQYYAQIQTFTDVGGTQGGSGLSIAKLFWCLPTPTLTLSTIPTTISTTSYNVSATYTPNTSGSATNEIQEFQFNLYSAIGALLQTSGVVLYGESVDLSYNFSGLEVDSTYYVTLDVTTTQGMNMSAQSNTFTVSIDTPTIGSASVVNNGCDGYISVTSNLSSEYEHEESAGSGEIISFTTDSVDDITELDVDFSPVQDGTPWMSTQNTEPYMFRPVPTQTEDFGHESDTIVGGTVAWNQMVENGDFASATGWVTSDATLSVSDNVGSFTASAQNGLIRATISNVVANHKYITTAKIKASSTSVRLLGVGSLNGSAIGQSVSQTGVWQTLAVIGEQATTATTVYYPRIRDGRASGWDAVQVSDVMVIDLTAYFGSTIADYVYTLEQATTSAGVAWLRTNAPQLFEYQTYDSGSLVSVSNLQSHDMVGFNQWDEEWELGTINTSTGAKQTSSTSIRSKNYIPILPNTTYSGSANNTWLTVHWYDSDKNYIDYGSFKVGTSIPTATSPSNARYMLFRTEGGVYGTTYNHDICINLSDASLNGTYEPYVKHSYPLDNTLTLRGIPKLDNGKLYYDGDTYESDGTITRKYDEYTFTGTETWTWFSSSSFWYTAITGVSTTEMPIASNGLIIRANSNNQIRVYPSDNSSIDSSTDMNAKFPSGTKLVFAKITPTTSYADPYTNPQIVDPHGTEQYVGSPIPVGHETTYQRICPISGWDSVEVDVVGVNLFPWVYEVSLDANYELTDTGVRVYKLNNQGAYRRVAFKVPIGKLKGQTLTFSADATIISGQARVLCALRNSGGASKGTLFERSIDTYNQTFTVPNTAEDTDYISFSFYCTGSTASYGDVTYSNVQLELGTTKTAYQPYQDTTYTSTFPKYKQQVSQDTTPYITKNIGDTYADTLTENLVGGTIVWNQSVPDTTTTHTASGSIASMDDAMAGNFESVVCDIEPLQDLHGYDKPWVGGAGVNKYNASAQIINTGASASIDGDTITATANNGALIVTGKNAQSFPAGTYTCSAIGTNADGFVIWRYTVANNTETQVGNMATTRTFTADEPFYLGVSIASAKWGQTVVGKIQLEIGSTATSWAPWENLCPITGWTGCDVVVSPTEDAQDGTTYPVSWQTEAGTVYGGTLDLVTGVLTVDRASVDLGALNWVIGGLPSSQSGVRKRMRTTALETLAKHAASNNTQGNIICSIYSVISYNGGYADVDILNRIAIDTDGDVSVFVAYNDYETAADFKSAMSGKQLVYELATPVTHQLDPVQVACLLGQNNVWNNIADTTVTYPTNHSYQSLSTTHKYYKRINGVESISVGSDVVADVGTDNIIDLTQMFGTTIADYIYNREQSSSSGMGVKFFKSLFPNDDYDYNSGTLISVNASVHVIKDANGNVLHTYPLDSDLVLRGIPKLDANNKLYYDGDVYEPSGRVTRKYGIVDLGTLNWYTNTHDGKTYMTSWSFPSMPYWSANVQNNMICAKYKTTLSGWDSFLGSDKTINSYQQCISVYDSTYTDATAFKAAMSGVMLVYELATPATEQADPFEENQAIVSNGIEEYIVTEQGDVEMPVGHDSTYYTTKVYDGTIDMAKGVLTINMASVDMGMLNWVYVSNSSYFYAIISNKAKGFDNIVCNVYENASQAGVANLQNGQIVGGMNDTAVYVKDSRYTDAISFKASVSGYQLVYELETPIEISFTPQQIQTLSGQNNIWSNTNGGMYLVYQIPITSLLVKRRDVADVSGKWLTLYSTPITQASDMDFTFIDFLNQYGKTYQYALVPVLAQDQSGVIVQIEGGYTVSDNVDSIFDGVYIADQTNVERVKAGVGYGNIDMNQGVGSITPIGSKYPIVITNSQNQYHNGSIRGTIVPNDFYSNGNLSRIDMVNKRDELEQFLTNKRAKIIKDWNGKMWLVMIMSNVACSFDDNYGMGMVSFSADWLEVGDPTNQQDLYNAGLINVGGV